MDLTGEFPELLTGRVKLRSSQLTHLVWKSSDRCLMSADHVRPMRHLAVDTSREFGRDESDPTTEFVHPHPTPRVRDHDLVTIHRDSTLNTLVLGPMIVWIKVCQALLNLYRTRSKNTQISHSALRQHKVLLGTTAQASPAHLAW